MVNKLSLAYVLFSFLWPIILLNWSSRWCCCITEIHSLVLHRKDSCVEGVIVLISQTFCVALRNPNTVVIMTDWQMLIYFNWRTVGGLVKKMYQAFFFSPLFSKKKYHHPDGRLTESSQRALWNLMIWRYQQFKYNHPSVTWCHQLLIVIYDFDFL